MGMIFRMSKRNFISFMNKKRVNTWSQLATAFNSKEPLDFNLLAEKECVSQNFTIKIFHKKRYE